MCVFVINFVFKCFKVFKMVVGGVCVVFFVKFFVFLFMVSRKVRELGVLDMENRVKREEDYFLFLLLF